MQNLEQTILHEISTLTDEQKRSVLSFARFLKLSQNELDLLGQQAEVRQLRGKLKWDGNLDEMRMDDPEH
jgi:hypothetical protein